MTPNDLPYGGLVQWVGYAFAFVQEIFAHLFDIGTADQLQWEKASVTGTVIPSSTQWVLTGNFPNMTQKGEDIVAAIMTIAHNGIVALAQLATLLPATPLD